jgi:hypothetical protein
VRHHHHHQHHHYHYHHHQQPARTTRHRRAHEPVNSSLKKLAFGRFQKRRVCMC